MYETFLPAERRSKTRYLIGGGLGLLLLVFAIGISALFLLPARVDYEVSASELVVRMKMAGLNRERRFSLDAIEEARPVQLRRGKRVSGSGMPGYCQGRYRYPDLGNVWQATSCVSEAVVLRVKGEDVPIVLTPESRDDFLANLREHRSASFEAIPARGQTSGRAVLVLVPFLLLIPACSIPIFFFIAPARLKYRVGEGQLIVDLLWRKRALSLTGARAERTEAKVSFKIFGSAMPGYYAGVFMVNKHSTRVYASKLDDGVVLTNPGGDRLFVSPADIPAFLDAVRSQGAAFVG